MLKNGCEEEVFEDLIDKVLRLYNSFAHLNVEVLDDFPCQLHETNIDAFLVLLGSLSAKLIVGLDSVDNQGK